MRVLLDSHYAVWVFTNHPRLEISVRRRLAEADQVFVSPISVWELSIKRAHGKIHLDLEAMIEDLDERGISELPVTRRHGLIAGGLPPYHHDPFDRLLLAQAMTEELTLVTADGKLRQYESLVRLF